jgi:hypothetical protein
MKPFSCATVHALLAQRVRPLRAMAVRPLRAMAVRPLLAAAALILLAACSGGAVVFAPTPLPPDRSPTRFAHPSGLFTVDVPRDWAAFTQSTPTLAAASFSPPGADGPLFSVAVARAAGSGDFAALLDRYQTQVRPDIERYTEQNRAAMADGSWRMTGVRAGGAGAGPLNTFIQAVGEYVVVSEVRMADPAWSTALQAAVNSVVLTPGETAALAPADLAVLALARTSPVEITHVAAWTTPDGVFFITGEVANTGTTVIGPPQVEAALLDAAGARTAGAVDSAMTLSLAPGGFAPFSLRFGGGQPENAVGFTLDARLAAEAAPPALADGLTWDDAFAFDENDRLIIQGTAANTGPAPVAGLRAVATLFDGGGRVIGAAFTDLPGVLAPGASTPYTLRIPDVGGDPANYTVLVQGIVQE